MFRQSQDKARLKVKVILSLVANPVEQALMIFVIELKSKRNKVTTMYLKYKNVTYGL